jgi:hypothetical protein
MRDVCIIYAQEDQAIADKMCGKLEAAHPRAGSSRHELSGEDWAEAIAPGVHENKTIAFILSGASNE